MDLLALGIIAAQVILLCVSSWLLKHRYPVVASIPLIASAFLAAWALRKWPFLELATIGLVVLAVLVVPSGIRTHPRRNAYLSAFALLALALILVAVDQPRRLSRLNLLESTFVFGIHDPKQLKDIVFLDRLAVELQPIGFTSGTAIVSGTFNVSAAIIPEVFEPRLPVPSKTLRFYLLLPKNTRMQPIPFDKWKPDELTATEDTVLGGRVLVDVVMKLSQEKPSDMFYVDFVTELPAQRMHLGEHRVLLGRGSPVIVRGLGRPFPGGRQHVPPLLVLQSDLSTTDLAEGHPSPQDSQRDSISWSLDVPDDALSEPLEVTFVDRRIRFFADQLPEILLLGAGLLLGLLTEPAARPRGIHELLNTSERLTQETENLKMRVRAYEEAAAAQESRWRGFVRKTTAQSFLAGIFITAATIILGKRKKRSK